jgi:hypothetical protein
MILSKDIGLREAFIFMCYSVLLTAMVNPFAFLSIPFVYALVLMAFGAAFLMFTAVFLFSFKLKRLTKRQATYLGIVLGGLLTPMLLWMFFGNGSYSFITFFWSFSVFVVFALLVVYTIEFLQDLKSKVNVKTMSVDESQHITSDDRFVLENEQGKVLLDVPLQSIICFEANDNYVTTYYLDEEGTLKKSFERFALKQIEAILANFSLEFLRVHRSYIVNAEKVIKVSGKSQAYKLHVSHFDKEIPVSRSVDVARFSS